MSSLTPAEKRTLERVLDMGSGYVLDFSDRTFADFILDNAGIEIYTERYAEFGKSKAKHLRAFWKVEPDHVVARLLTALLDHAGEMGSGAHDHELLPRARQIVERLRLSLPVEDLDAIAPNAEGKDFDALALAVREAIQQNRPESGLDRLHTFLVKYIRVMCREEGIETLPDKPLHSLFGELLKSLNRRGLVESAMADRILKSTISILEAFNEVRNDRSLAHDNPLLSYQEALLIFNSVASAVRFLSSLREPGVGGAVQPGAEDIGDRTSC